jgi:hypothetical protein
MCRPPGEDAAREPDAHDAHVPYSYNDPSKDQSGAGPPFDFASVQPIGAANPPKLDPEPTQVVRQADRRRDYGDETSLLGVAPSLRHGLGQLHACSNAMADGDAAERTGKRRCAIPGNERGAECAG